MFSFLRRIFGGDSETDPARKTDAAPRIGRSAAAILAECEREVDRLSKAHPGFVSVPRDVNLRAGLHQRATQAGLADHDTVKRLEFLDRVIDTATVDPTPALEVVTALVDEAKQYQFEDIQGVRLLRRHVELERLKQEGPHVIGHDQQGRAVYYQCTAEFKNREGRFEVREDGVSFTGEVAVEVGWGDVAHVSKTTHTYRGDTNKAIAIQEGKRRTPTKFVFPLVAEADYACEVTLLSWAQRKKLVEREAKERPSQVAREGPPETVADPEPASPPDDRVGTTIEFPSTGSFPMAVVGESRRQATLRSLAGNRLSKGETVIFTAAIVPEPKNSFDPNAVAVYVQGGGPVGYLSREDAVEYKPVTEALIAAKAVGLCRARLIGGTAAKPSIGVMLDLADPSTLVACLAPTDSPF